MTTINDFFNNLIPTNSEIKSIVYSLTGFFLLNLGKNIWNTRQLKKSYFSNRNNKLASSLNMFLATYELVFEKTTDYLQGDFFLLRVLGGDDHPKIKELKQIKIQLGSIATYLSSTVHEFNGDIRKNLNEIIKSLNSLSLNNLTDGNDIFSFIESGNRAFVLARDISDYLSNNPDSDLKKYSYKIKLSKLKKV